LSSRLNVVILAGSNGGKILANLNHPIRGHILDNLRAAAGPRDSKLAQPGLLSKAKPYQRFA
jgi:hypothetical protein